MSPLGWDEETRDYEFPCTGYAGCKNMMPDDDLVCRECEARNERENAGGCPGCGGNCQTACR